MNQVIKTLIFSILISLLFNNIPNKSNIPNEQIIPLMCFVITKFIIGDWDIGSKWSLKDLTYFISLILISFITIKKSSKIVNIKM